MRNCKFFCALLLCALNTFIITLCYAPAALLSERHITRRVKGALLAESVPGPKHTQKKPQEDLSALDQVPVKDTPVPDDVIFDDHPGKGNFDTTESVVDYVLRHLPEATWEWSETGKNVVVVRRQGSGYRPGGSGESAYDDLILVVSRSNVWAFGHGNAEGTENAAKRSSYGYTKYRDPYLAHPATPALAPGQYKIKVDYHQGQYRALFLYSWNWKRLGLPSQRLNGKYGKWEVGGVNLHQGGDSWNYSVGCLTIHYSQWDAFMRHFPTKGKWGRLYIVGDVRPNYHPYNLRSLSIAAGGTTTAMVGETFRVAARIENQASVDLGPFSMSLHIDGNRYEKKLPSLRRHSILTINFDTEISINSPGIYPCSFLVDNLAQISESNERDNKLKDVAITLKQSSDEEGGLKLSGVRK